VSFKLVGVEFGGNQGPDHIHGVLRIIGHHAVAKQQSVSVWLAEKFLAASRTEALVRQSKGVPDGGAENASGYGFLKRHLTSIIIIEVISKIGFWFKIPSSPKGYAGHVRHQSRRKRREAKRHF
jgi:hypothetical protein